MTQLKKELAVQRCQWVINLAALETWKRLPEYVRAFVSLEDLKQEARLILWRDIGSWNRKKSKLTTFAYLLLRNHFTNQTSAIYASKRKPREIPAECLPESEWIPISQFEIYQIYQKLFKQASPETQKFLAGAFGVPQGVLFLSPIHKRFRLKGKKWLRVRAEIRELSQQFWFEPFEADFLVKGQVGDYVMSGVAYEG